MQRAAQVADRAEFGEVPQLLAAAHRAEQAGLAGQVGHALVHLDRLPLAIQTVDPSHPRRRPEKAQQDPQQRRLARSIGPQQSEDFALRDAQRAVLQRGDFAVAFRESQGFDQHASSPRQACRRHASP